MADSRDSASCVRLHRHRQTRCVDNAPISSVVAPFIIVVCIDEKPGCDRAVRIVILSAVRRSHFSPTRGGENPYIGTVDSIGLTVSATRGFDWTLTRRAGRGAHRGDRAGRSRNRDDLDVRHGGRPSTNEHPDRGRDPGSVRARPTSRTTVPPRRSARTCTVPGARIAPWRT